MKRAINLYTTPEQSKRLIAIGAPKDSADMCYFDFGCGFVPYSNSKNIDDYYQKVDYNDPRFLPCWSAANLMYIYDVCVMRDRRGFFRLYHDISDFEENGGICENMVRLLENCAKFAEIDFSQMEE